MFCLATQKWYLSASRTRPILRRYQGCGSGDPLWEEFFRHPVLLCWADRVLPFADTASVMLFVWGALLSELGVLESSAGVPAFATLHQDRAVEILERDGRLQAFAVNLATGRRRMVTSAPDGVDLCEPEPDGRHLWWFDHGTGQWARQPFEGGPDRPALTGVPGGRMYGIAFDHNGSTAAVSVGVAGGSRCYAGRPGEQGTLVASADGYLGLIDMAPSGRLVAMAGRPDGPNAVCLCPIGVGEQVMLAGTSEIALWPLEFNPDSAAPAELLLAVRQAGRYMLATWRHDTGVLSHDWLRFDAEISARWYGGGRTVLVQQDRAGRSTIALADLDRLRLRPVPTPPGSVFDLTCAPDGRIHLLWSRADIPPRVLTIDPSRAPDPPPATRSTLRHNEIWTGQVHSFLTTPPGGGPWPTVFLIHGGPATHDRDCFDPQVNLFAGAGFTVVRTNYRGSTGYGSVWRNGFGHTVGLAQLADLAAVRADLIARGVSVPERIGLAGYSWGGYLTLLGLGVQPDLWAFGLAAYPIADYPAAYLASPPALREVDEELFGGTPAQVPERYEAASPMSYVDSVCAAVLLASSPTDDKCPAEHVERYAEALRRRGVRHELVWVGGGHHSRNSADHNTVADRMLEFATDVLTDVPHRHTQLSGPG